jgi:uncharacterized protein (UPF0332 family)
MSKSSKKEYIDYRLNQAKETLDAAKTLAKSRHWNSVINRMYYSCFYAISALLYKNNIDAKSHSGIKHQFGLHFVKTGLIDKSTAEIYIELFDYRQTGDYADFVDFDKEKTLPLIPRVENFLIKIEGLIEEK